jgi:hypothetical protein
LKEVQFVLEAFAENQTAETKRLLSVAWHTAAMMRSSRLVDHSQLMGEPTREQSDEELWDAMETWIQIHNAKYEQRRLLGMMAAGEG